MAAVFRNFRFIFDVKLENGINYKDLVKVIILKFYADNLFRSVVISPQMMRPFLFYNLLYMLDKHAEQSIS